MTNIEIEQQIQKRYDAIQALKEQINDLQNQREPELVANYTFVAKTGEPISLNELFGDKDELIVIHNMGKSCSHCSLWADGFMGYTQHIEQRCAFVLVCPDAPEVHKAFAESRDWNFKSCSSAGNTFTKDMGFAEEKDGKTYNMPGFSVFKKEDDKIYRTAKDQFGPGDFYMPLWHFFDVLPKGVNGFQPK
ncbi:MAG: DUF899 family protein [Chitinophagales bacterium]|nr:DUF899 family protein [Chitinophagales bacterium]